MHAENVGIQTEKLENLRISIARGSPMWETLEFCIDVVDSDSLEILVPRLSQLVRSGIGLNTRYFPNKSTFKNSYIKASVAIHAQLNCCLFVLEILLGVWCS